jgi:hypothetical protein
MREILYRRLSETTPGDSWSIATLNETLNSALAKAQVAVMKVDPMAFVYIANQNIVAGQEFYDKPAGTWFEVQNKLLDSSTGRYNRIKREDYALAGERTSDTSNRVTYSNVGRHFAITPVPTTTIVNGLQTLYVPTLSMTTDSDVPDLKLALHMLIPLWAHRFLLGDTEESTSEVNELINAIEQDIPIVYRSSGGDNQQFVLDLAGLRGA